jgi:hypothetical protein
METKVVVASYLAVYPDCLRSAHPSPFADPVADSNRDCHPYSGGRKGHAACFGDSYPHPGFFSHPGYHDSFGLGELTPSSG